ncbi:phosphate ABC transporter substrate-binding/OmpA family protein [Methylocapsa polymorpha]|uniref:Phosphate ABC transporter substrate-binding/OmpA family protein n=1 Tax=Methylocapsa polymorpha TaxID=3080828 RepID=A0ABZ0HT72_9HYPH|nr:phosphate ABC transporter substrate-binding/OmpA family protein [Methylocapsa sp. RX1]
MSFLSPAALGQTLFCLSDGTQINAERFETLDGKFLLFVTGGSKPLEYPSSAVRGINVSCPSSQSAPVTASLPATPPRFGIYGSNTIGERLMPMLIDAYGLKRMGVKPSSKLSGNEEQEITIKSSAGIRAVIDLQAHGSATAAPGLIDGKALIGMASRQANPEEARLVNARFGVDIFARGNEHVLGLDGVAVIVNPNNPVKQMSLEQIAHIFSGQITSWKDVGGPDRLVKVFRRDNKSGTFDTFKSLVLGPSHLDVSPQAQALESSELLTSEVARDPDAIGFIGLPYIGRNVALTITSQCGIASSPSQFSVKTEEYPLTRRLYLYTIGAPSDSTAVDLIKFALSDEAQATVQEAEFVDQGITFQDSSEQHSWTESILANPSRTLPAGKLVPSDAIQQFRRLTQMRRSSIVFRFEAGSSRLDNRAQQDIVRLVRHLSSAGVSGKQFYIVGFADATGGWAANQKLAGERVAKVVAALESAGLRAPKDSLLPLSYMAPAVCNDSEAGRRKNRRVEVWLAK